jgi:hypothetical protein
MALVGQAPPCRKPDRRDQARFEALNRAGSGWEIVRETLKRPWSTGSDSLSRTRPTSPSWSATRSATCGRHSTRLPIASPARNSTIGRLRRTNRRSCAARRSSGSGVPDDSPGTAVRVRRAAEAISGRSREDAVGRSQEAERDSDVGFVLNRLLNVYKHRRLSLLAATLAPEAGR